MDRTHSAKYGLGEIAGMPIPINTFACPICAVYVSRSMGPLLMIPFGVVCGSRGSSLSTWAFAMGQSPVFAWNVSQTCSGGARPPTRSR